MPPCPICYTWTLGTKLRSSGLQDKNLTNRAASLTPDVHFLSTDCVQGSQLLFTLEETNEDNLPIKRYYKCLKNKRTGP